MHGQSGRRPVLRPAARERHRRAPRRPGPARRARRAAVRYPVAVGAHGTQRAADWRLAWSDERLAPAARARGRADRRAWCTTAAGRAARACSTRFPADCSPRTRARWPSATRGSTRYTPVNEPLTTARFSGLYGTGIRTRATTERSCARCSTSAAATRAGDAAIREVNPRRAAGADRGPRLRRTARRALAYQAEFENQRRWLSFDLLCGRVDRAAPAVGVPARAPAPTERSCAGSRDDPCPPDIVGINYYLTSERFLDERAWTVPAALCTAATAATATPTSRRCACSRRPHRRLRRAPARSVRALRPAGRDHRGAPGLHAARSSCAGCSRPGTAAQTAARRRAPTSAR